MHEIRGVTFSAMLRMGGNVVKEKKEEPKKQSASITVQIMQFGSNTEPKVLEVKAQPQDAEVVPPAQIECANVSVRKN